LLKKLFSINGTKGLCTNLSKRKQNNFQKLLATGLYASAQSQSTTAATSSIAGKARKTQTENMKRV
jgi:hypothetical protein